MKAHILDPGFLPDPTPIPIDVGKRPAWLGPHEDMRIALRFGNRLQDRQGWAVENGKLFFAGFGIRQSQKAPVPIDQSPSRAYKLGFSNAS